MNSACSSSRQSRPATCGYSDSTRYERALRVQQKSLSKSNRRGIVFESRRHRDALRRYCSRCGNAAFSRTDRLGRHHLRHGNESTAEESSSILENRYARKKIIVLGIPDKYPLHGPKTGRASPQKSRSLSCLHRETFSESSEKNLPRCRNPGTSRVIVVTALSTTAVKSQRRNLPCSTC